MFGLIRTHKAIEIQEWDVTDSPVFRQTVGF